MIFTSSWAFWLLEIIKQSWHHMRWFNPIQSRVRFFLRACSRYQMRHLLTSIGASSAAAFIDKHEQCMPGRRLTQAVQFVLFHLPSCFVGMFRRGLFEAFEVSFLFEAIAVSFSTLLHYYYCRVSHLLCDHCVSLFHLSSCLLFVYLWTFFASLV